MKCTCCGKEVGYNEKYCSFCGQNNEYYVEQQKPRPNVSVNNNYGNTSSSSNNTYRPPVQVYNNYYQQPPVVQRESAVLSVFALVFGLLGGWLGLVLGIIGLTIYKESGNRARCTFAIVAWFVWLVVYLIILLSTL